MHRFSLSRIEVEGFCSHSARGAGSHRVRRVWLCPSDSCPAFALYRTTRNTTKLVCPDSAILVVATIFAIIENSIAYRMPRHLFRPLLCPSPSGSQICPLPEVCPLSALLSCLNVIAREHSNFLPFLRFSGHRIFHPTNTSSSHQLSAVSFLETTPHRLCHLTMSNSSTPSVVDS